MISRIVPQRTVLYEGMFAALSLALLLLLICVRAPHRQIPSSLFVSDGFGYYIYLPSLIIDGDLDLSNQLSYQSHQPDQVWYRIVPSTGRPGNVFQVGCALLWAPFFLVSHLAVIILNYVGMRIPANGFGFAYELPVYCGSFMYGLAGLWFIHRLLTHSWGREVATVTTFYIAMASGLTAYIWIEPDMSHVLSMFLISWLFYSLSRIWALQSLCWRRWAGVGLLLGLIACVRVPDSLIGIVALGTGLTVLGHTAEGTKKAFLCVVACAACAAIAFLPQLLAWKALYGGYLTRAPGVYNRFNWFTPDLAGYLFSTRRGMFLWTPLFGISTIGLFLAVRRGSTPVRLGAVVCAAAIYFNCVIPNWWVGCSFGDRRIVDYSVLFSLGLGQLLALRRSLATAVMTHIVGLALCAFNWILIIRYFSHLLPEYGNLSYNQIITETIVFPFRLISSQ